MKFIDKKGLIGRTMTLLLVIIFVFLIMAVFDVYSATIASNKKGNSDINRVYEVNSGSVLFKEVNLNGSNTILLDSLLKDFEKRKVSKSDFSSDLTDAIRKMMKDDVNYNGNESCLAIDMNQADTGEMILSIKNFFKKDVNNTVGIGDLSRAVIDYPYLSEHFTKSELKMNGEVIDVYQYYGVCK